jgi:hypothetical protein
MQELLLLLKCDCDRCGEGKSTNPRCIAGVYCLVFLAKGWDVRNRCTVSGAVLRGSFDPTGQGAGAVAVVAWVTEGRPRCRCSAPWAPLAVLCRRFVRAHACCTLMGHDCNRNDKTPCMHLDGALQCKQPCTRCCLHQPFTQTVLPPNAATQLLCLYVNLLSSKLPLTSRHAHAPIRTALLSLPRQTLTLSTLLWSVGTSCMPPAHTVLLGPTLCARRAATGVS